MSELGTKYIFVGGNNKNRIGGSCSIIEHKHDKYDRPTRIMLDLGALFAPEHCLDVDAAIPDVREYLNSDDNLATKKLDAIFISHGHEDHIGGYVHLARAGFEMPETYASKSTLELLKSALQEADIDSNKWPKMTEIEPQSPVNFKGIEVEAINMSHSTIGALGFHILTSINNQPEAGIFHPGDYHLGEARIGNGFNEEELKDLLDRKIVTNVILDSTSSASSDKYVIDHKEAVSNTVDAINQHPEKQVISAVISRSLQNMAIDLDAAKQTGRTIYLDGYWAKIAFKAMQRSGINEFNDIIFNGNASEYLSKIPASKRYIIPSGAFAESKKGRKSGLYKMSEQERVKKGSNTKQNNKKKKLGHPDFTIDDNTLILARQRCIEEINGKQVRAMYNKLSALGATIVANEAETKLGNYKTNLMQRSGHASMSETKKMIQMIGKYTSNPRNVTYIPTHGNPQQLINTAKVVKSEGENFYFGNNLDVIKMGKNETKKIDELTSQFWIGVCEELDNTTKKQSYTYSLVDENFIVQKELKTITTQKKNNNIWNRKKHQKER